MTARSGLFVGQDGSGNGSSPTDARLALAGILGTISRPLAGGAISQSGSNMQFTVAQAVWQLPDASNSGATFASPTDATVLTLAAGPASGSRIDSIVVKQNNPENGDADSRVSVSVIQGTAASSPVAPTIPAGSFEYARVAVPTGVSTATACTVTVLYPATLAPRSIGATTLANLRTIAGAVGQLALVYADSTAANNGLYRWNGSAWVSSLVDSGWSLTPITLASGWSTKTDTLGNSSGTLLGGLRIVGNDVQVKFRATRSGAPFSGDSQGNCPETTVATFAAAYRPAGGTYRTYYIPSYGLGAAQVVEATNGTAPGQLHISSTPPSWTINTGDVVQFDFSYPLT